MKLKLRSDRTSSYTGINLLEIHFPVCNMFCGMNVIDDNVKMIVDIVLSLCKESYVLVHLVSCNLQ